MDMLCPECMGTLASDDGKTARCTIHGGRFRILFSRGNALRPPAPQASAPPPLPPAGPPAQDTTIPESKLEAALQQRILSMSNEDLQAMLARPGDYRPDTLQFASSVLKGRTGGDMCRRHSGLLAIGTCSACAAPVCGTCAFPQADGTSLCPECAMNAKKTGAQAAPPALPGVMCAKHAAVAAVRACKLCGCGVCATCDFEFPGGLHVCPDCVTKSGRELSPRRRKTLIWSYVLAVWATFWLTLTMSGVFSGSVTTQEEQQVFGYVFAILVLVPAVAGTAMSIGGIDRRLGNPPAIWVSAVWNGIILLVFLLLCVIGSLS